MITSKVDELKELENNKYRPIVLETYQQYIIMETSI